MLDATHLLSKVRSICKNTSGKSINGLGERLGVAPKTTRQAKSDKVKSSVRRIFEAIELLERIAAYLEVPPESLVLHEKIYEALTRSTFSSVAREKKLFHQILRLPEENRKLVELLICQIS